MNQQPIEKAFFQQLSEGHYIDHRYSENEWKIAKIIQRQKQYAVIQIDGMNSRQQQIYLKSMKNAPFRLYTQCYTGSIYRPHRLVRNKSQILRQSIQKLKSEYLSNNIPSAFIINQYLRGQIFVLVHQIICREDYKQQQVSNINLFLCQFVQFVIKFGWQAKKSTLQYFESKLNQKLLYLTNENIASIYSLNQLLWLVNIILDLQKHKFVNIVKHKQFDSDLILKNAMKNKADLLANEIIMITDGNGKWLPINIYKRAYFLSKISGKIAQLPIFHLKDYNHFFNLSLYIIQEQQRSNNIQQKLIKFIMQCLKQPCPFQAKLRAIIQLKKIIEQQTILYKMENKQIFQIFHKQKVIQKMTDQFHFNPQIFKRIIPILKKYSKIKSIPLSLMLNLLKLSSKRHPSQQTIIQQIICQLAQFVQIQVIDSVFTQIIKKSINNQQQLVFIKNYGIKAINNYSSQQSFFSLIFSKTKKSSKHGFYGLDLLFKQIQDEGSLIYQFYNQAFQIMHQIFQLDSLKNERQSYLIHALNWVKNGVNFGQGIKIIDVIVSTYPSNSFLGQTKNDVMKKFQQKYGLLDLIVNGLKKLKLCKKMGVQQICKCALSFIDNYFKIFGIFLTIQHIKTLWIACGPMLISIFLKKIQQKKQYQQRKKSDKQSYLHRYSKRLDIKLQQQIIQKLTKQQFFVNKNLTYQQFQMLDEIFISLCLAKQKITISQQGLIRYNIPLLQGSQFYFVFLRKLSKSLNIEKIVDKTIKIFIKCSKKVDQKTKIKTWNQSMMKIVINLRQNPEACLKAVGIFLQQIKGRMSKQLKVSGNTNIKIIYNQRQTILLVPKNITIFKLRYQVMKQLKIRNNFQFFWQGSQKYISFEQQQDFSVNVLNNSSSDSKHPVLIIKNVSTQVHHHIRAYQSFIGTVKQNQKFYDVLFNLYSQNNKQLFWKIIDELPVNDKMVKKIKNCEKYNISKWKQFINRQQLQFCIYYLNIINNLLQDRQWVILFIKSQGIQILLFKIGEQIKLKQFLNFNILIKCFVSISKIIGGFKNDQYVTQGLKRKIKQIIQQLMVKMYGNRQITFNSQLILRVFQSLNVLSLKQSSPLPIQTILLMLSQSCFVQKSKITGQLFQKQFIFYLINSYRKINQKDNIYNYLLANLNDQLLQRDNTQHFFGILIDFMNSFIQQQQLAILNKQQYLIKINVFLLKVFKSSLEDTSKSKSDPTLLGSLKLNLFLIKNKSQTINLKQTLQTLIEQLLFNKQKRRIKCQSSFKALMDLIKKIFFINPSLIPILIDKMKPRLQNGEWRKNDYFSWSIDAKPSQKNIYCGLQNLGATCYINCLLQQLTLVDIFRQQFISVDSRQWKQNDQQNQILQFQKVISSLWYSNRRAINTKKFCESFITYEGVPINPMIQSDADQFMNQLMEKLQTFLRNQNRHDIIQNTFQGSLSNQLICQGCPHKSEKLQNFLTLGVNIKEKKTLEQALQGYVEGQILDGDNAYFCEICQKKVKTLKRLCINKLPRMLIIVLKRFSFNYDEMKRIKINSKLTFPHQINMKPYTAQGLSEKEENLKSLSEDKDYKFKLRGTVIHSGTAQGGHYYSYIKRQNKWFSFNDEFVEGIQINKVQEQGFGGQQKIDNQFKFERHRSAYMLFYQRQQQKIQQNQALHKIGSVKTEQLFKEWIRNQVVRQNVNSDFLSIMLNNNFIRLIESLSCYQCEDGKKILFLYFHSILLRDKCKQQNLVTFYRLIQKQLDKPQVASWYLQTINSFYLQQFLIDAPKNIRYITTGLLIQAIKCVSSVSENLITTLMSCLKKNGMTPFTLVFKELSSNQQIKDKLIKLNYPQKVINIILERTDNNNQILATQIDSYFGRYTIQKQKQKQYCISSLVQSLQNFNVSLSQASLIYQKLTSRKGAKIIASKIISNINEQQLTYLLGKLQLKILNQKQFRKQDIDKYMIFFRQIVTKLNQNDTYVYKSLSSIKKMIFQSRDTYEPLQLILKQLNNIANKSQFFKKRLQNYIANNIQISKCLKNWLKQAEKPQTLTKSQNVKRKLQNMDERQRQSFFEHNLSILRGYLNWMLDKQSIRQPKGYNSDLQQQIAQVRGKRVKIKQTMGLLKFVQYDGIERWSYMQKFDIDTIYSL